MSAQAKEALIAGMDERRQRHIEAMQGIPLDAVVHPESGWRVQDLLGHLAYFERLTINMIEALKQGETYHPDLTGGIDAFNDRDYQLHKDKTADEMMQHWQATREALKATLMALSDEEWQMTTTTLYSRQQPITPEQMAKSMGVHEAMHMKEILTLKEP